MTTHTARIFKAAHTKLSSLLAGDEGAGLAEYALLLLLIAMVCVVALTTLGTTISSAYNTAVGMFN